MNNLGNASCYSTEQYFGNITEMDILIQCNSVYSHKLIYNSVLQIAFLVFGIIGNAVIIFIYRARLKRRKEYKFFITVLAVTDLVHCIFSSSFTLTKNLRPLLFPGTVLCKFLLFFTNTFYILSLLILIVICIHRYQKICRPLKPQMTQNAKRMYIGLIIFIAAFLASPKMIYWGERRIPLFNNVKGIVCGPNMAMQTATVVIPVSGNFIIAVTLGVIIAMAVLYSFVGRVIFKQMKQIKEMHEQSDRLKQQFSVRCQLSTKDQDSSSTMASNNTTDQIEDLSCDGDQSSVQLDSLSSKKMSRKSPERNNGGSPMLKIKKARSKSVVQMMASNVKAYRSTIMFMFITLVTIVAYIPTWVYVIYDSRDPKRWFMVSNAELQVFVFMRSMNAISYMVNPFIYAYYDKPFRTELKKIIWGSRSQSGGSSSGSLT